MKITIVTPVYNEEACLEEFYRRTKAACSSVGGDFEWLFVDDGSRDSTPSILAKLASSERRIKILTLARNFGHQAALKAGIDHATGDAVIMIDADLQDPPEAIPQLIAKWQEGFDVVYAVRAERQGESWFKKVTATCYYRLMRKLAHIDMPLDAGDFRLLSRPIVDALKTMKEKSPYLRGLISWMGFRQVGITIKREPRFAGVTKYPLMKMLQFAWNGITHFSFFPLQVATWIGVGTLILCVIEIAHTLYVALVLKITVPGWASLMAAILFLGSVQLITAGIIGSYLARNYDESRNRPLYLIQKKEGF